MSTDQNVNEAFQEEAMKVRLRDEKFFVKLREQLDMERISKSTFAR